MRKATGRAAIAVSLFALFAGCKFESTATPTTQVVVDIDAEPRVRARLAEVTLYVASAKHRDNLDERIEASKETVKLSEADPEGLSWPLRMVLTPKGGDSRRVFELSATATDATGEQVAQARVITGYVTHQIRYVKLVLEDDCIDITCGELDTCRVGGCTSAFVEPDDLPLLPGPDTDAGMDAGDAGDLDAMVDSGKDGGRDGGDGGPPPIDPCLRNNGGCDSRVLCQTIDGVPTCGQCPNGFVDVNGNGSRCEDVDECAQSNKGGCDAAHGKCTNTPGGHDCACEAGYHGDGRECTVNVPCTQDPAVCDPLATCQEIQGQKVCQCNIGYTGDGGRGQCLDIDECARNLDDCPAHATCTNKDGTFDCTCDAGWERPTNNDNVCINIDECMRNTDNCDDMPDACQDVDNLFTCQCPAGYTGSGVGDTCQDIDECALNTDDCDVNADCMNMPVGSFTCTCKTGYRGAGATPAHGAGGCVEIDECVENTHMCNANATCMNMPAGDYTCMCNTGYMSAGSPPGRGAGGCVDVDECTLGTHMCNANATCMNMPAGDYTCMCNNGYSSAGSPPGRGAGGCTENDECTLGTHNCNANAMCSNMPAGDYTCTCNTGYSPSGSPPGRGTTGCTENNECMLGTHNCNANATCSNMPAGDYTCTCNNGYSPSGSPPGRGTTGCTDNDECMLGTHNCNANATCSNMPAGDYTCTCNNGYSPAGSPPGRGSGGCVVDNECTTNTHDCNANADCMDTPSSFNCNCKTGYMGAGGNPGHGPGGCVNFDGCAGSPCQNGGTCNDDAPPSTGHSCMCACGFEGTDCMTMTSRTNRGPSGGTGQTVPAQTLYAVKVTGVPASRLMAFGMSGASSTGQVRLGLYADSGGNPGALVASAGPSAANSPSFPVSCVSLSAGDYWIAVVPDQVLTVDGSAGGATHVARMGANALTDPFGATDATPDPDAALSLTIATIGP